MFFFGMGIRNPSTYMVVSPRLVTPDRTAGAHFDTPRKLFSELGEALLQEPALGGCLDSPCETNAPKWVRHLRTLNRASSCTISAGGNDREQIQPPRRAIAHPCAHVGLHRARVIAVHESTNRQPKFSVAGREELQPPPANRFMREEIEDGPQVRTAGHCSDAWHEEQP